MLIYSFLYSTITSSDSETLFKLRDEYVPIKDRPCLVFVKDFYSQYNKLPDISTVEAKFSVTLQDNTENTEYWFREITEKYQNHILEEAILKSAKDKGNAIEIFQQAILDHSLDIDSKVSTYSEGNRRAIEYEARKGTQGITYLSCGKPEIDEFSLGYKRADLWTLGGFESSGKTWLLLRFAEAIDSMLLSQSIKKNVLIVSGEMEAVELEERLDSIRCGLSYSRLSRGELTAGEERTYKRYLSGADSNIKIVDSFDNLKDVDYLMTVYRPAIVFIDGSHLLASSYDWTEIARVTATMKKMTRNKKIPIFNTTHLKADKGKSSSGGNLDDFAYTKGYTRDSDIVGVIFKDDMMELENKVGVDWVKVRRGNRTQHIWTNDYDNSIMTLAESRTGSNLLTKSTSKRNGQANDDFDY